MAKKPTLHTKARGHEGDQRTPIPFDDALRRLLTAPPQHKTAKTPIKKK